MNETASTASGTLAGNFETCPACHAVVRAGEELCLDCGWDFEEEIREYHPAFRRMPIWLSVVLGLAALAGLLYAVSINAGKPPARRAAMPPPLAVEETPAAAGPDTSAPDLADPEYVASLVDSRLASRFPMLGVGDSVSVDIPGEGTVTGTVAELRKRNLVVESPAGRKSIPFHHLDPDLRVRCDAEYRVEYRRRSIKSELRRRRAAS